MRQAGYSLREKKHVRTKVGLMNAFMERLQDCRFDDISVREICRSVEISEGTFFNYFPEKIDVVVYYLHCITLELMWSARRQAPPGRFIPLIDSLFAQIAAKLDSVNLIYQILSALLVQNERPRRMTLSELEKKTVFPNCEGIEAVPTLMLDEFLVECIKGALKSGELPVTTNINDTRVSLMSIIMGTLIAIKFDDLEGREYHYMRQLQALWKSLGVVEKDSRRKK